MADMVANHISMRVPGKEEAFLINPYGMLYEEITASSLIKIDLEGNVLSTPDFGELNYAVNRAGYVILIAIHEARPEVACILHTHSRASMAVSAIDCGQIGRAPVETPVHNAHIVGRLLLETKKYHI